MKAVDQDVFMAPEGNCFTACVASLLEVSLDAVRDLEQIYCDGAREFYARNDEGLGDTSEQLEPWHAALKHYNDVLAERFGVMLAYAETRGMAPAGYAIAGGTSPRSDCGHSVVTYAGRVVHDPHHSRAGLSGPPEMYGVLVPVRRV